MSDNRSIRDRLNAAGYTDAPCQTPGKREIFDRHGTSLGAFSAKDAVQFTLPQPPEDAR